MASFCISLAIPKPKVNANSLVAGKEYRLNFQCAETLSGLIHWQLRLYKDNDKDCYKEYQSYFALKPKVEAITLNILQGFDYFG